MEPTSLLEAVRYFSDPQVCIDYVARKRWPNGPVCPTCGSESVTWIPSVKRFQCSKRHPRRQFTVKTGSIFEDSPLPLDKWLMAMWLIVNAKNGISSYELHRAVGVSQKTAWFMLHRIRLAMQSGTFTKLGGIDGGPVEVDEAYFGGDPKNMHAHVRAERDIKRGRGTHKTAVVGLLERGGDVRAQVIRKPNSKALHGAIKFHVEKGTTLYTDSWSAYLGLGPAYQHFVIDHAKAYVDGLVHTNGMENFWSLLKRTIKGTYVSVEPFHLHRYLDEQAFRFNERKANDNLRFALVASQVSGKRLTYAQLTGKVYN